MVDYKKKYHKPGHRALLISQPRENFVLLPLALGN